MIIIHLLAGAVSAGFGVVLTWLIFPLFYNKWYTNGLLERGYLLLDEESASILTRRGLPIGFVTTDDDSIVE